MPKQVSPRECRPAMAHTCISSFLMYGMHTYLGRSLFAFQGPDPNRQVSYIVANTFQGLVGYHAPWPSNIGHDLNGLNGIAFFQEESKIAAVPAVWRRIHVVPKFLSRRKRCRFERIRSGERACFGGVRDGCHRKLQGVQGSRVEVGLKIIGPIPDGRINDRRRGLLGLQCERIRRWLDPRLGDCGNRARPVRTQRRKK